MIAMLPMDAITRLEQKIEKAAKDLTADRDTLQKMKATVRSKEKTKERRRDTRRKIIVGAVVLRRVLGTSPGKDAAGVFRAEVLRLLDEAVGQRDRPVLVAVLPELERSGKTPAAVQSAKPGSDGERSGESPAAVQSGG